MIKTIYNKIAATLCARRIWRAYNLLAAVAGGLLIGACASMGRPQGGPRDVDPPVPVSSNPKAGQLNFTGNRLHVTFDENIQLEDAFNKVIVSPAMATPPVVTANGRRLTVEFRDTLRTDNVTYTVDFADAIKDLNEGNVLDGFALDFSTGPTIDTLRISGMVLGADNLEPAQGILVGVHTKLTDTTLTKTPLERIARTNQYGQFTIRNLPQGEYYVYAIDDVNRDNRWDRSETVGFAGVPVSPSVQTITVTDTLRSSAGADSTATRQGVRYLPNDVLITTFLETNLQRYLADHKRVDKRRLTLTFATPNDSLPRLTVAQGELAGEDFAKLSMVQANPTLDTLTYWLHDSRLLANDTLRLAATYYKSDSLYRPVLYTDTLRLDFRSPKKKKGDDEQPTDSLGNPIRTDFLNIRAVSPSSQDLNRPLEIEFSEPVRDYADSIFHLEMKVDTLWHAVSGFSLRPDSVNPLLRRTATVDWTPGTQYRLRVDSAAVYNIYDDPNRPFSFDFKTRQPEDYSAITFRLTGPDPGTPVVVELLNSTDKPVYRSASTDGTVKFEYLNPATYYARLIIDSDGDGRWTTGDVEAGIQPEEVYYFSKKLTLKKNWEVDQDWNIYEVALDLQKPLAIKKNKPKPKAGEQPLTTDNEDEEDEYDPNNPYGTYDPVTGQLRGGVGGTNRRR